MKKITKTEQMDTRWKRRHRYQIKKMEKERKEKQELQLLLNTQHDVGML